MAIPILGEIERFITEHGSSVVLKEHLALLNTKLALLKTDVERMEAQIARLTARNAELEQQVAKEQKDDKFVEARGALFKRKVGGGHVETPYCPNCHRSMSCFRHMFPYECSNKACGHKADFKGNQLHDVLASLPAA